MITVSKKAKILIVIGVGLLLISIEAIYFEAGIQKKKNIHLLGTAVPVLSRQHVPDGTKITYNSNPPSSGKHYNLPQDAGIYTTAPADGHLVHSLEHGAIILWYNPQQVSKQQLMQLTKLFKSINLDKKIMTPRLNLPTPVALSSWGRVLKLKTTDEKQIKAFFNTNYDNGPEQAAI
jgi:hypothetical protein